MIHLRYVATGTGRSGTVGLASALSSMGIPCSHERFFNGNSLNEALRLMETNGGQNSYCSQHCGLPEHTDPIVAESSYMAAPYLDAPCFADTIIIHAVRNPWKVILSFLNNIQFFRGEPEHEHEFFIYSFLPRLYEIDDPIDRAVYYYIRWNRMIEMQRQNRQHEAYVFHRIEDGWGSLLSKLGLREEDIEQCRKQNAINAFKEWPKELRYLAPARQVQIENINACSYAVELRRVAQQYGYEAPVVDKAPVAAASDGAARRGEFNVRFVLSPRIVETGYRGYDLVRWQSACYALLQGKNINIEASTEDLLKEQLGSGEVIMAECLSELKAKVDEISGKRAATVELQATRAELGNLRAELQATRTELDNLQTEIRMHHTERENLQAEIRMHHTELENLQAVLRASRDETARKLTELSAAVAELQRPSQVRLLARRVKRVGRRLMTRLKVSPN